MAETQKRRLVFLGTSGFAAIILDRLAQWNNVELVGVYTGSDKKSGRGMRQNFSEVKKVALQYNLPVHQPITLRNENVWAEYAALQPDMAVVAAYGLLLPPEFLAIPAMDTLNVHASLLPDLRGAAPIQRFIMENPDPEAKTGVSIMRVVPALDAGPVYARQSVAIGRMNSGQLQIKLANMGAVLLIETLDKIFQEKIAPFPQDQSLATYAHKLTKKDGEIDWNRPADEIDALVRGVTPWPGAQAVFTLNGAHDAFLPVTVCQGYPGGITDNIAPGSIWRDKDGLKVACSDNWYHIERLRPSARKEMSGLDFANGQCRVKSGLCGYAMAVK